MRTPGQDSAVMPSRFAGVSRRLLGRHRDAAALARATGWAIALGFDRAAGVRFGPGVTVNLDPGATLRLGANSFVAGGTYLHVAAGAALTVGADVFIGHHCVIMVKREVVIGDGCALAEQVSIRDHDHVPGADLATGGLTLASVRLGDDVWVASKVTITRGVTIGDGAVVGAGGVVTRDVAPRTLVAGVPARPLRSL